MSDERSDHQLLCDYLQRGSEEAFRLLVERHLQLVFGTACRQLRDRMAAEEVAQNVFKALARRAWMLLAHKNLAGWLYRASCLEIRQRQRAECRLKTRELRAAEMEQIMATESTSLADLQPLLDEGLCYLRAKDRQVLILRFLEDRSLAQVGAALGISEDTAQKRVATALSHLSRYFQRKGYKTATTATVAALLGAANPSAPAGLAAVVTGAAFAPGTGFFGTGVGWLVLKCLCATKPQALVTGLCLTAAPLAYQAHQAKQAEAVQTELAGELHQSQLQLAQEQQRMAGARQELAELQVKLQAARADVARKRGLATNQRIAAEQGLYHWSESADYVRLPKSLVPMLTLSESVDLPLTGSQTLRKQMPPVRSDDSISSVLEEALGITQTESSQLANVLREIREAYEQVAAGHYYLTNRAPVAVATNLGNLESLTFMQPAFIEEAERLNASLRTSMEQILGVERAAVVFTQGLGDWATSFNGLGNMDRAETVAVKDGKRILYWKCFRIPGNSEYVILQQHDGSRSLESLPAELRPFVASKIQSQADQP